MFNGSVSNWLKARRGQLNLTQKMLADLIPCSIETIRKIEGGRRSPSAELALALGKALQVQEAHLKEFVIFLRGLGGRRPLQVLSSNLPAPNPLFMGREGELAKIRQLLHNPNIRLITLIGMGGIGKTELAIEAGRQALGLFPNGVWLVRLQPISDPGMVPNAITGAIESPTLGQVEITAQVTSYLRQKSLLLILDNMEHVLDCADFLTHLMAVCAGVKLLVTSRERLKMPTEYLINVEGLSYPHEGDPQDALNTPAVQFFLEQVRRTAPNFVPNGHTQAVVEICRHTEGLPLALILAASLSRTQSLNRISELLAQNQIGLSAQMRGLPHRHRSARAVLEQSWVRLSAGEQAVFSALSVFRGSFDADAALIVAGATPELLSALCDKSLVRVDEYQHFGLHEMFRQFAAQHLDERGQTDVISERHCIYYLTLIEKAFLDLDRTEQLAPIHKEFDNIRAAFRWCLADASRGEIGWQLFSASISLWQVGYSMEGKYWYDQLHAQFGLPHEPLLRARTLWVIGGIVWYLGYNTLADRYVSEAEQMLRAEDNKGLLAYTTLSLGMIRLSNSNLPDATACGKKAQS